MHIDIRDTGTPALPWRRLIVLCEHLADDPATATWRKAAGPAAQWPNHIAPLIARAVFALEVANWQRGADEKEAKARRNFPDLVLLPGQSEPHDPRKQKKTFRGQPKPIEWMRRRLGW